jgi:transcriptional regulator with XRE-family HTH domain
MTATKTKTRKARTGPLVTFIRTHYGTSRAMAEELGVTPQTVSNWLRTNPLQILKHCKAIEQGRELRASVIVKAALGHAEHLQRNERN